MKLATGILILTMFAVAAAGEEAKAPAGPLLVHLGLLTLRPAGFVDTIGMSRSATTADSVSTKFGKIPIGDSLGESLGTARHSRLMLTGDMTAGRVKFSSYLEADFMNFTANQSPYRWRQYWGRAKMGKWEVLGGQAWSLLRPNRVGTASDRDTMNTDVIDPAYHVGLLGTRVRQIRLTREMGTYAAALAWEADGNVVTKIVRDKNRRHLEAGAFTGRFGRRGVTASAAVNLHPRFRLVTQEYWSKRAAYQALGVVPAGVNGLSTIEGFEAQVKRTFEVYSYAGVVYASQADAGANRLVRQWSIGFNQVVSLVPNRMGVLLSLQYSHLDRAVWNGRTGAMDYLMYRVRYTLN